MQHTTAKAVAIGGALTAAAFVTTLVLSTNGCSKSKQTIAAPVVPASTITQPAPVAPAPMAATAPAALPKPVKKHSNQHILFAYKNPDYGISFLYPKEYRMKKGEKANLEWAGLGPVEMNFVEGGGQTLAAVQLPTEMFPGTDFVSGFFNVSVNPKITSEQCAGFAFEDAKQAADSAGTPEQDSAPATELKKVKFGATEYTETESTGGEATKHAQAKYYHVYENGACYELALGLEIADANAVDAIKPVDSDAVFRKLNWMLSTVKITGAQDKATQEVAKDAAPATTKAADSANTATVTAPTPVIPADGSKN